jgi:hypothetical protein
MDRVPESKWKWFGNAGHFICARDCQFHICTLVGEYLVSTIGEMWPERSVREVHAKVYNPTWLAENRHLKGDDFDAAYMGKFGYAEVGFSHKYETMVFKAGTPCTRAECNCGLPEIDGSALDFEGYNDAGAATRGHMEMCRKWAAGKPMEVTA